MAPPTMVTDDNTDGAIWVTYSELAAARNTDRPTAKRLAMRRKWRRMQGNDGNARVLVPREAMAPAERHPGVNTDGDTGRQNGVDAALIEAVATLRADAETLRVALDREAARAAKAESKLAAAERATEQARAEADQARQRAEALRRADDARKAASRWRRLRAAWRGE